MSTYAAQLDLEAVFRPPKTCPECGAVDLVPADDGGRANFYCAGCGCCWHYEMGWLSLVDPRDCAHCRHQERCLAHLTGARFPRDGRGVVEEGGAACGSA